MLKIITTLTLILIGLLAKGQELENRKASEFSKVEVKNGIELIYTENNKFSLQVETKNYATLKNVITEVKGKTLNIYLNKNDESNQAENSVKVYLSSKNVDVFKADSNAKITVMNQITSYNSSIFLYSGASFTGNIKNEGTTKLIGDAEAVFNGKIETKSLKGNFKNNAKINITGMANKATIQTYNMSLCNAKNFIANSLYVSAEGNSTVLVHADAEIVVNVADKAKVTYTGLPESIRLNEEAESLYKLKNDQLLSLNY